MPGSNYSYSTGEFLFGSPEFNNSRLTIPQLTPPKPVNLSTFDPEEGMYDAYIEARNSAIGANASKRKLERFYKKFRKQWDEGEALRKSEFEWNQGMADANKRMDDMKQNFNNRNQQLVLDFKNSFKPFENPIQKQETPALEFKTNYWLSRALVTNPNFKSIDDIKAWQQQNGLVADGKFGDKSLAKWTELNSAPQPIEEAMQQLRGNGRLTVEVPEGAYSGTPATSPKVIETAATTEGSVNPFGHVNKPYDWGSSSIGKAWNAAKGFISKAGEYLAGPKEPIQVNAPVYGRRNMFMEAGKAVHDTFGNANKHENGGTINKFSKGGNMNDKELQKAFVAFLIQDAEAQGITIQSEEDMKNYIQQLGEEGYAAKQLEFMLKMQGTPSRKLGGHLAYLNKLKGNCPEGEELVYMKEGGRVCPKCMKKAEKAKPGTKLEKNAISDFKEKRKIAPSDTVHVNGQPRSLTDSQNRPLVKGMKTYSASEYQKDMKDAKKGKKDAANRVEKSDMKTAYGCGGVTKKLAKKKK